MLQQMTHNIHDMLNLMLSHLLTIDQDGLTQQQQTFIDHIKKTLQSLINLLDGLPAQEYAYIQVIPILGDQFVQPLVAIYGYAKLLMDSPSSFADATITTEQYDCLSIVYQHGRELEAYAQSLEQQAFDYRLQARKQAIESVDLVRLIRDNIPLFRYWIRHTSIEILANINSDPLIAQAQSYHLTALIQHIITVIATEIMEVGQIQITIRKMYRVELHILCTGLRLEDSHLQTLLQKDGRDLYYKQLQKMNGNISVQGYPQNQSAIIVRLGG